MKNIWENYKFGYWLAGINIFLAIVLAAAGNVMWVFNMVAALLCYNTANNLKARQDDDGE